MKTFLEFVAEDLSGIARDRHDGQLRDMTVIFPNKRASLFLNQQITKYMSPPFWTPRYSTISELFQSLGGLTVADPVLLVYYLYKAYTSVTGKSETFDQFYSWGEVLLNDFEDIDNNMVDAGKLFVNITDLEALSNFDYIDKDQEEAIRRLFDSFSTETTTELHRRYLEMWNKMPQIYHTFRSMLRKDKYAYSGMLKREVAEKIRKGQLDDDNLRTLDTDFRHPYVVGFNVLNETEKTLFKYLKDSYGATFYWDYDEGYTQSGTVFEAGSFISDNIKLLGNRLVGKDIYDNLRKDKTIRFVSSPTDNAQCSYAGTWLSDTLTAGSPLNRTAVVLCDEHLLQPLLHSIPDTYADGLSTELNITMGYPMQETPVAGFVMALLELVFRGWKPKTGGTPVGRWRYTYVDKVLKHPYLLMMNRRDALSLLADFKKNNNTFPRQDAFKGEFIEDVFSEPSSSVQDNIRHIAELVKAVAQKMAQQPGDNALYSESVYNAWTILNRFHDLIDRHDLTFDTPETLIRLVRQAIASRSIAFHGEPAVGVQVMGILETRNLDFDNIIMLSTGEGMLPKAGHSTSFILNFLREAHGMTTVKRQTSLYAYYFYRLLQRAENVTLVYNSSTDGLNKGEMSRFMMQLKYEGGSILADSTRIQEFGLVADEDSGTDDTDKEVDDERTDTGLLAVDKSAESVGKGLDDIERLSPSALNTYMACQLQFYLGRVCGFREDDEINENVADNVFGSIFHRAMEYFYLPFTGQVLDSGFFNRFVRTDAEGKAHTTKEGEFTIRRCVDRAFALEMFKVEEKEVMRDKFELELNGSQLLNHKVISKYVKKQIASDSRCVPLTIHEQEREHYVNVSFPDADSTRAVQLGGIIDRVDSATVDGTRHCRIADYKTSSTPQSTASVESLFLPAKNRASHIFQTFYYSEVMMRCMERDGKDLPALSPALLYIKLKRKEADSVVKIGKDPVTDYQSQCHDEYSKRLKHLLTEVFDRTGQFVQNDTDDHCKFCPFKMLCGKEHRIFSYR